LDSRSEQRRSHRLRRAAELAFVLGAFLAAGGLVSGCGKDESAPGVATSAPSAAPDTPAGPAQAAYRESAFDVVIRPVPPFAAGKPGVVEVQLDAKGDYHLNDTYPYRFKTHAADGVTYSVATYSKDAMKVEGTRGTMRLEVTPASPGARSVSGLFLFSVCSAERCLVEKRELAAEFSVD
jgi:hypothetical protein